MRIPISIFLAVWAVFMLVFLVAAFLTVFQMKKFGIRGPGATVPTAAFIGASAVIFLITIVYLMTVNWGLMFDIGNISAPSPYLPL